MKITNQFTVSAPMERAWNTMIDLERIAPCLPGASIDKDKGGGEYDGTMKIKIGPITASYEGTVKFEEADEANRRAVLRATGRDVRGQGTVSATIVSTLQKEGEGTKVSVETDMELTGRAAQFGRGIAQDVATKMLDEFAACLERELSDPESAIAGAAAEPAARSASENGTAGASSNGRARPGATVEGAVVAGSSPTEAAASAPTTETPQPTTHQVRRRDPAQAADAGAPDREAFDAGAAGREAALRRLVPVLAGALLVLFLWRLRRRGF